MKQIMAAVLLLTVVQTAQPQRLNGEGVLKKVEENFRTVQDYTVTLDVVTDIERMKIPPIKATMYFKQPEKVHFESKGFALLPREGMGTQFGRLNERYAVDSMTREMSGDTIFYRLLLRPRDERMLGYRVRMKIRAGRWTPESLEVPLPDGRAMHAQFTYLSVARCWLPSDLVVSFVAGTRDTLASGLLDRSDRMAAGQRTGARVGTLTIRYSDYKTNTGLPDSLFESSAPPRK